MLRRNEEHAGTRAFAHRSKYVDKHTYTLICAFHPYLCLRPAAHRPADRPSAELSDMITTYLQCQVIYCRSETHPSEHLWSTSPRLKYKLHKSDKVYIAFRGCPWIDVCVCVCVCARARARVYLLACMRTLRSMYMCMWPVYVCPCMRACFSVHRSSSKPTNAYSLCTRQPSANFILCCASYSFVLLLCSSWIWSRDICPEQGLPKFHLFYVCYCE